MKRQGYGRVISLASMSWRGTFGQSNYVAAKAGIVGLTRTLALEGARHGITANAHRPWPHRNPHACIDERFRTGDAHEQGPDAPHRPAEDIAEAAAFLASEAAGYISGVVLDVDGGSSIGSSVRQREVVAPRRQPPALLHFAADPQGLRWRVAERQAMIHSLRSLLRDAARRLDDGHNACAETASAKLLGPRVYSATADMAIQAYGGEGFMADHGLARHYRSARGMRIYMRTDEMQLSTLAKSVIG